MSGKKEFYGEGVYLPVSPFCRQCWAEQTALRKCLVLWHPVESLVARSKDYRYTYTGSYCNFTSTAIGNFGRFWGSNYCLYVSIVAKIEIKKTQDCR